MEVLTLEHLASEAEKFSRLESGHREPSLFGITDGKAVGTYIELKFKQHLRRKYEFEAGNAALGIDFPGLMVDVKVTSIRQPQSSSPFKSARQKVYGLGYGLLIFVYDKTDDPERRTATLNILHTLLVDAERTADYQTTVGILNLLQASGNRDDVVAFILDRNLPVDEIGAGSLADEILSNPPKLGFLTISNALQWRLQYSRVIERAGKEEGIVVVYRNTP